MVDDLHHPVALALLEGLGGLLRAVRTVDFHTVNAAIGCSFGVGAPTIAPRETSTQGWRVTPGSRQAGPMTAPTTIVLFGATGDLAKRKLIPGLLHLFQSRLVDDMRVVGTSLDDLSADEFRDLALVAIREHSTRVMGDADWHEFAQRLDFVPMSAGPLALGEAVAHAEAMLPGEVNQRLHYLSVPPKAALSAVRTIAEAGLVERSRVVMEKPFGTDYASSVALNAQLHEVFDEEQIFRIDHFLGKEPAQNILAFRFANGLFEPIWHRNNISHIEIDVPETLGSPSAVTSTRRPVPTATWS